MKNTFRTWTLAAAALLALAGCGGSDGDSSTPPPVTPPATVKDQISAAAAVATNDTSANTAASFTVVQAAGLPAITVGNPTTVNFTVLSNGAVVQGLNNTNVRFAIAKLIPGRNGNPDEWKSYIYRSESTASGANKVGSGANGAPVLATALQATTDASTASQLVYNADGYYTYTFATNLTDPTKTGGVVFEPGLTHRVAIQLSYKNAAGETVLVNPYIDVTFDAAGKSVLVTDPSKTRKMTDVASCNGCHEKLALHGGGRIDTQYCVMCHNQSTVDANSGNNLNMATMTHKIHAGRLLQTKLAAGQGGEDYAIWGFGSTKHDYAEVGFPQDLRNCTVCHSASNPNTPQGDNWKTKTTKEACLTCHTDKAGSTWEKSHTTFAATVAGAGKTAADLTNQQCVDCHKPGSNISPERVHFNQDLVNSAKYQMNIESATYDAAARKVTVKYFLSDPTNNNAAYNLVTSECTGAGAALTCANTTKFGNLRIYLAYQNMVGQSTAITEYTAYNNGGNGANVYAYKGTNDGSNHYTIDIPLPADTLTAVAFGTARVVTLGQIKEAKLEAKSAADPRPEVTPKVLVNTLVKNTFKELALTGTLQPRRTIVSNEKCNVCHGALGTTSGSNTLADAFHSGARNTVEACVVCHDPNRASSSNMMTNGLNLYESYQFKPMIHGIHGNSKRVYPFTHGNKVVGAFNKDGTSKTGGAPLAAVGVENYAAEVAWPGVGINCNACHENNSYKRDQGPVATTAFKDAGVTDVNLWKVISPKASTCTTCHDSSAAISHVTSFGGSAFGNKTHKDLLGLPRETCDDCHSSGGFKGVDIVHGQK
ncbi:OmcA/MtrC family decaheme c-type cytochrome [Ideonella sp. A 288]|uniref:OmcA/MtrC family decaheme c-type cytochrome n=1 Tax=Ideonella sp. A 288 TaxID=1962181 RepID=UPI000B4B13AB|nr:OmcA/MtrC family decaheme c-type cytochrome [Ideonella sp. A 288]